MASHTIMNTDFSFAPRLRTDCIKEGALTKSCKFNLPTVNSNTFWIKTIRWRVLFNQLFCWSALIGGLLALLFMPSPVWILVGISLVAITTPDVNQTAAHMALAVFGVVALGILWHSRSLISNLNSYLAFSAYLSIFLGLLIIGAGLFIAMSAALMAAKKKGEFFAPSCFNHYQSQFVLSGTVLAGLALGYGLIALIVETFLV